MARLSKSLSRSPKADKKRKLSATVSDSPRPVGSGKKAKKHKNKSIDGPELRDPKLGDHDFSILSVGKLDQVTSKSVLDSPESLTELDITPKTKTDEPSLRSSKTLSKLDIATKKDKKRKLSDPTVESPKTLSVVKKLKTKQLTDKSVALLTGSETAEVAVKAGSHGLTMEQVLEKYPVLRDEELVKRFMAVPISNNQKGRIRQNLRDLMKGSSGELDPDVVGSRLAAALAKPELTNGELRKVHVLHNMLRTAAQKLMEQQQTKKSKKKKHKNKKNRDAKEKLIQEVAEQNSAEPKESKKKKQKNKEPEEIVEDGSRQNEMVTEKNDIAESDSDVEEPESKKENDEIGQSKILPGKSDKVKGPKRYVVFLGNLPFDTDKDAIMRHFSDLVDRIKDVRIPKKSEPKKGGIAYLELQDEPSYQMALSKHHTMMGIRRINVLYTTTGTGRVDKSEAKGKTAKLVALQRSGKLLGSVPRSRKRSARRKKQKLHAQASQTAAE